MDARQRAGAQARDCLRWWTSATVIGTLINPPLPLNKSIVKHSATDLRAFGTTLSTVGVLLLSGLQLGFPWQGAELRLF